MMTKIKDMPKLHSPFARREIGGRYVCIDEIEKIYKTPDEVITGSGLVAQGRDPSQYEVIGDYSWVFEDSTVLATEKLHGTNVSLVIEGGHIASIWNRTARIPFFNHGQEHIVKGVLESYERGYCELPDGQWFGELIGPKVNGNPYGLSEHRWIPFQTYCQKHLAYKSWGKYPKDYATISKWFEHDLQPLYSWKLHGQEYEHHFVEGIVFVHPDGRMAKLRRDMFDWYRGDKHKEASRK